MVVSHLSLFFFLYLISLCTVWRLRNLLYFLISRRSGVFLRFCFFFFCCC